MNLNRSLMEKNDRLAERNRGFFRAKKLLVLNVVSSPGSGKTTFIRETAAKLAGKLRVGVINSIGVRRDPKAVGALASELKAADPEVAGAASFGLAFAGMLVGSLLTKPPRLETPTPEAVL